MSLIYIARPIDHANPDVARRADLAETTADKVLYHNHQQSWAYHPVRAFKIGSQAKQDPRLNSINNRALESADALLVLWPHGSKSWGVPAEVALAQEWDIPVVIVTEGDGELGWASKYENVRIITSGPMPVFAQEVLIRAIRHLHAMIGGNRKTEISINGNTLEVRQIRPDEGYTLPSRANHDDAGLDLYVSRDTVIPAHSFMDVPTNTAIRLPKGTWGHLTGRSSTLRRLGLLVNPGVIDEGYTGELYSGVQNLGSTPVTLHAGDRVAQLIIAPNLTARLDPATVEEFSSEGTRGAKGFGSSGS